ncbi:MAG: CPBP family intramembrane glutamic endopeptidase [Solirubrobacterales bacterium]
MTEQANSNISNKELRIFFIVNFGVLIILGIMMFYLKSKNHNVSSLANIQMLLPAAAAMVAFLSNREKAALVAAGFYKLYLFFAAAYSCSLIFSLIIFGKDIAVVLSILIIIVSMILIFMCFIGNHDKHDEYGYSGLIFNTRFPKAMFYIILFVVLYFLRIAALAILSPLFGIDQGSSSGIDLMYFLQMLIPNIFVLIIFFGEEYGWRYFLQGALQKRFGAIKGIIILGLIWGIWHLPLDFTLYSPATPWLSVMGHLFYCVSLSIFFGYVFMKTRNVWIIAIFHYLNNCLVCIGGSIPVNVVMDFHQVLFGQIITLIIYLPFLYFIKRETQKKQGF